MTTFVVDSETVRVPTWVKDLSSFRRWVYSEEFPESGRICFLNGETWVDMSKEQLFSHNQVKGEFTRVLGGLVRTDRLGRFIPDGMLLTNVAANLASVPDGIFVSFESFRSERVRMVEGMREGFVELEGSPEMVLEITSDSSVSKDRETLRDLYQQAGIDEYWLVDARGQGLAFTIYRNRGDAYFPVRKHGGWIKSAVFGKSFRLTRQVDPLGHPEFTLEVR